MIRHRRKVLALWLVLFALGAYGRRNLGGLLTQPLQRPGLGCRARARSREGAAATSAGDGAFTLVARTERPIATPTETRASRPQAPPSAPPARSRGEGRPGARSPRPASPTSQITTPLENADASEKTPDVRAGDRPPCRRAATYLTGFPAINHDTHQIYNDDIARGESIAVPIAVLVMAFMFGTLAAIAMPLAFAPVTIPATLGAVWIFAHFMDMAIYMKNIVTLIGVAIAIDYSMLVVFRFREELARNDDPHDALERRWCTAGRATLFSGHDGRDRPRAADPHAAAVHAIDGRRRLLVPLVLDGRVRDAPAGAAAADGRIGSIACASSRGACWRRASRDGRPGFWTRLARSIMRRPVLYLRRARPR